MLLAPRALPAQSIEPSDLAAGKLLVARETDRRFSETVILLIQYDEQGALGLTLNRKTKVPISEALKNAEKWSDPVYLGGPVETEAVFGLLRSRDKQKDMKQVLDEVYWVASKSGIEKVLARGPKAAQMRIYLGYSGWGAGQLDNEVREGSWYIFDASADLVFDSDPSTLWKRLKDRTEQRYAYQTFPFK